MKFKTVIATFIMSAVMCTAAFASEVSVSLNGNIIDFPNQQPTVVDGRTLIPLRGVFDKMGYSIDWDNDTKTATLEKDGKRISVQIGENKIYIDGSPMEIDVPAQLINGSTMLPMRAITDASGTELLWDNDNKIATIIAPELVETVVSGTAQPATEEENAYLESYVSAFNDFNIAASNFIDLGNKLNNGELESASDEDYRYAVNVVSNLNSIASSTINKLKSLTPPAKYSALHSKTLEYLQSMSELGGLYYDVFTSNYENEDEVYARLNEIGTKGAIAEAEFKKLFAEVFK